MQLLRYLTDEPLRIQAAFLINTLSVADALARVWCVALRAVACAGSRGRLTAYGTGPLSPFTALL